MRKTVALYTRVSTAAQNPMNQEIELRAVAERAGWDVVGVYTDHAVSGGKSRKDRPAFDRLLKDATRRKFDIVAATSVDRLGRSLTDLLSFLGDIHTAGIDLFIRQEGLDTTSPTGKAAFALMSVFAEFERALIRERVMSGLARARAEGRVLGRPRIPNQVIDAIRASLTAGGHSLRQVAAQHRVGLATVQRVNAALKISMLDALLHPPAIAHSVPPLGNAA
jgi:DNA invertase Pin-like site-specific DNA recombinase